MKNLAEFKRAISPGVRLHIENHFRPEATRDTEVVRVLSDRFTSWAVDGEGKTVESHLAFPKSAQFVELDGPTCRFVRSDNGDPFVTITLLPEGWSLSETDGYGPIYQDESGRLRRLCSACGRPTGAADEETCQPRCAP